MTTDQPGNTPPTDENPNDMLKEIDAMRMAFVRDNLSASGKLSDNLKPELIMKVVDDTAKSLSRRAKQAHEDQASASLEIHRTRALALADELVRRSAGAGKTTERYELNLPAIPDIVDITPEEISPGIVKLDPTEYQ